MTERYYGIWNNEARTWKVDYRGFPFWGPLGVTTAYYKKLAGDPRDRSAGDFRSQHSIFEFNDFGQPVELEEHHELNDGGLTDEDRHAIAAMLPPDWSTE